MTTSVYRPTGAAFLTANLTGMLEAYWNDIKALWRGLSSTSSAVGTTDSLYAAELDGTGQYAEYAIPSGERVGTRGAGNDGEWLASFNAVRCRLVVGSTVTRPGQKRLPWLRESDVEGNSLVAAAVTAYDPVFAIWSTARTLGAPVATGVLNPAVGGSAVLGVPTVFQDVTGKVTNGEVGTQTSRRKGRGA